jgi:hypothetical protein
MINKGTFLILLFLLTISCKKQENKVIVIDPQKFINKKILLSELAEEIEYVPLDNIIPFSHVVSISISDSSIYACVFPVGILRFDRKGKLLNRVGKYGKGPGEYKWGNHFTLDVKNSLCYVLNYTTIIVYNSNGYLIKTIHIDDIINQYSFSDIIYKEGILYLFEGINLGYAKYCWVGIDTLGNKLFIKPNPIEQFVSNRYYHGNINLSERELIYYWNQINDTIYQIDTNSSHVSFIFSKGNFQLPKRKMEDYSAYFYPQTMFFTKKYILLYFSWKNQNCNAVYKYEDERFYTINTSTDIQTLPNGPGIINDIDGGIPCAPMYYFHERENDILVGQCDASTLKSHIASSNFKHSIPKFPEKKKELEKLANCLNENDNPVLMLVKLKE